jgi:hypothetical protein
MFHDHRCRATEVPCEDYFLGHRSGSVELITPDRAQFVPNTYTREVIFEGSYFRVTATQNIAFDQEHPAIRKRSPVSVALLGVERCKVVLDDRDLVMLLPKAVLPDSQRLPQDRFGFGDPVLRK